LFGDLKDGGVITISIVDNDLDFAIGKFYKPLTKAEKKALKATVQVVENVES
jgi:hypothetical protein